MKADHLLARVNRSRQPAIDDHSRGRGLKELLQHQQQRRSLAGGGGGGDSNLRRGNAALGRRQQKHGISALPPLSSRAADGIIGTGSAEIFKSKRRSMPDVQVNRAFDATIQVTPHGGEKEEPLSSRIVLAHRALLSQPRGYSAPGMRCPRLHGSTASGIPGGYSVPQHDVRLGEADMPQEHPESRFRPHSVGALHPHSSLTVNALSHTMHAPSRMLLPQGRLREPKQSPTAVTAASAAACSQAAAQGRQSVRPPRLQPINAEDMTVSPTDLTPNTLSPPEPLRSDFSPPVFRAGALQQAAARAAEAANCTLADCLITEAGGIPTVDLDAQLSPAEDAAGSPDSENPRINLCFDPQLNCYFDPVTHRYFELSM